MKTIIANLKLFYPNRYLWLYGIMLFIFAFFHIQMALDQKGNEQLVTGSFMCFPFFLGFLVSLVLIDVLNKPFSFCLPGHRQNVKKVLVVAAVLVSLCLTFLQYLIVYSGISLWIISLFFANLIFFLFGAELNFFARNIFTLFLFAIFFSFTYSYPYETLGRFILQYPLIVACISLGNSIVSWFLFDSPGLARRYCDNPKFIGIFFLHNKEKLMRLNQLNEASQKEKSKLKISPSVERFFLNKMKGHKHFSIGRYIWGCLYQTFGFTFSNFKPAGFIFSTLFIFMFCYLTYFSWWILFMVPLMMAMFFQMPVYSNILISDGRRERFYSAIVLNFAITVLIIVIMSVFVLSSEAAGLFMPDLEITGKTLVFNPMSFKYCFLPLIVVPIASMFRLIFYKSMSLAIFSMIFCYTVYITLFGAYGFFKRDMNLNAAPQIVNQYSIIYLVIIWILFIGVLRHICFKRSLI